MWDKGSQYFKKIGGTILIAVIIIWSLEYFPRHEHSKVNKMTNDTTEVLAENQNQSQIENSYLGKVGQFIEPVLRPLGFDWKMGISLIAGIPAKEIVVSTMGVLYETGKGDQKNNIMLQTVLQKELYHSGSKAGEQVFNKAVALSFLIFVLLYFPCIAVLATISRESGNWKWSLLTVIYTTGFAWILSFLTYHIALGFF
jgi:ferrous iron transport protein B